MSPAATRRQAPGPRRRARAAGNSQLRRWPALALFGAPGPEKVRPDRWNQQAVYPVYPGCGVILPGALQGPIPPSPARWWARAGDRGWGGAPPIKAHSTRSQSTRCATCATPRADIRSRGTLNPDGRHRVPANVMLRHHCDPTSVRELAAGGTHRVQPGLSGGQLGTLKVAALSLPPHRAHPLGRVPQWM